MATALHLLSLACVVHAAYLWGRDDDPADFLGTVAIATSLGVCIAVGH